MNTTTPPSTQQTADQPIQTEGLTCKQGVMEQRTPEAMTEVQRAIAEAMAEDPDADYMTLLVRLNID